MTALLPFVLVLVVLVNGATAQTPATNSGAAPHVAAAKKAAGQDHLVLFNALCVPPPPIRPQQPATQAAAPPPGPPPRSEWYAPPVKVFDNLYFVGQSAYTAWAVTTSEGIIVIDPAGRRHSGTTITPTRPGSFATSRPKRAPTSSFRTIRSTTRRRRS